MNTELLDHRNGYGLISRFFHWLIAALILWQAISAALHYLVDDTPIADFFFAYHKTIGFSILVIMILRALWGLANISRRPSLGGWLDRLAAVGHVTLYALLLAVPAIALLREYGSGEDIAHSVLRSSRFSTRRSNG